MRFNVILSWISKVIFIKTKKGSNLGRMVFVRTTSPKERSTFRWSLPHLFLKSRPNFPWLSRPASEEARSSWIIWKNQTAPGAANRIRRQSPQSAVPYAPHSAVSHHRLGLGLWASVPLSQMAKGLSPPAFPRWTLSKPFPSVQGTGSTGKNESFCTVGAPKSESWSDSAGSALHTHSRFGFHHGEGLWESGQGSQWRECP